MHLTCRTGTRINQILQSVNHPWPWSACISLCSWTYMAVFPSLCTSLIMLSKQVGVCGSFFNHPTFLFVSPLTVLRLVPAHLAASTCSPFQCSWSETTNALTAPLASLTAHLQLQLPVTAQCTHFVSSVCPKIVSICIFENGNVYIINLYVRGIQREL